MIVIALIQVQRSYFDFYQYVRHLCCLAFLEKPYLSS